MANTLTKPQQLLGTADDDLHGSRTSKSETMTHGKRARPFRRPPLTHVEDYGTMRHAYLKTSKGNRSTSRRINIWRHENHPVSASAEPNKDNKTKACRTENCRPLLEHKGVEPTRGISIKPTHAEADTLVKLLRGQYRQISEIKRLRKVSHKSEEYNQRIRGSGADNGVTVSDGRTSSESAAAESPVMNASEPVIRDFKGSESHKVGSQMKRPVIPGFLIHEEHVQKARVAHSESEVPFAEFAGIIISGPIRHPISKYRSPYDSLDDYLSEDRLLRAPGTARKTRMEDGVGDDPKMPKKDEKQAKKTRSVNDSFHKGYIVSNVYSNNRSTYPSQVNGSWHINMICDDKNCTWNRKNANLTELSKHGWTLRNCTSSGCVLMAEEGHELFRKIMSYLLVFLSVSAIMALVFTIIFYYCRQQRVKAAGVESVIQVDKGTASEEPPPPPQPKPERVTMESATSDDYKDLMEKLIMRGFKFPTTTDDHSSVSTQTNSLISEPNSLLQTWSPPNISQKYVQIVLVEPPAETLTRLKRGVSHTNRFNEDDQCVQFGPFGDVLKQHRPRILPRGTLDSKNQALLLDTEKKAIAHTEAKFLSGKGYDSDIISQMGRCAPGDRFESKPSVSAHEHVNHHKQTRNDHHDCSHQRHSSILNHILPSDASVSAHQSDDSSHVEILEHSSVALSAVDEYFSSSYAADLSRTNEDRHRNSLFLSGSIADPAENLKLRSGEGQNACFSSRDMKTSEVTDWTETMSYVEDSAKCESSTNSDLSLGGDSILWYSDEDDEVYTEQSPPKKEQINPMFRNSDRIVAEQKWCLSIPPTWFE